MPTVLSKTRVARKAIDWFCAQRPSRTNRSASGSRQAVASSRAKVNSAVVSTSMLGIPATGTPRAVAAAMSTKVGFMCMAAMSRRFGTDSITARS